MDRSVNVSLPPPAAGDSNPMKVFQSALAGQPVTRDPAADTYPLAIQGLLGVGAHDQPYTDALGRPSLGAAWPQTLAPYNGEPSQNFISRGDLAGFPPSMTDVSSRYTDLGRLTFADKAATPDPDSPVVEPMVNINGLNYIGNGGDVASIAAALDSVPDYVDRFVTPSGLTVHATLNDIGQDPDFGNTPEAKNVPRGWEGVGTILPGATSPTQVTLGSLPGVYFPARNEVILATSPVVGQDSYDVDVHEFGHGVDAVLGKMAGAPGGLISNAPGFQAAVAADAAALSHWPSHAYYSPSGNHDGYLSESFAESFANYYGNTTGASDDEAGNPKFGDGSPESAPNLYKFMTRLDAAIEAARASKTPNATLRRLLAPILYPLPKK